jgi:TetR/AcrR family transcriptional regulator, transcriptional repressor for nem operon
MRYPVQQKAETKAKILSVASRMFRERGAESNGIGSVMKEIGFTKGGFYRHFKNRNQLYVEAVEKAFSEMGDGMVEAAKSAGKGHELEAMIRRYLSVEHLKSPAIGCVISTLGSDIARQPVAIRRQINRSMQAYRERLLPYVPGKTTEERMATFGLLYPSMVGVLIIARVLADPAVQETMLANARDAFIERYARGTS